jgi:hypothetical protein
LLFSSGSSHFDLQNEEKYQIRENFIEGFAGRSRSNCTVII